MAIHAHRMDFYPPNFKLFPKKQNKTKKKQQPNKKQPNHTAVQCTTSQCQAPYSLGGVSLHT